MVKKKVIKALVGEAYNKETKENYPVYCSYWENDDGTFSRYEKVFVNEVEVPDKKPKTEKVSL